MLKFKRIVTGLKEDNKAGVIFNDVSSNVLAVDGWAGCYITDLWATGETPVDNSSSADLGARKIIHDPVKNGSIFRIVEIPPESSGEINTSEAFGSIGSGNRPSDSIRDLHPSMHFTNSIDYLYVAEGKMNMIMENGEKVLISKGDCIVQRGTYHGWQNVYDKPCVLIGALIDASPIYKK